MRGLFGWARTVFAEKQLGDEANQRNAVILLRMQDGSVLEQTAFIRAFSDGRAYKSVLTALNNHARRQLGEEQLPTLYEDFTASCQLAEVVICLRLSEEFPQIPSEEGSQTGHQEYLPFLRSVVKYPAAGDYVPVHIISPDSSDLISLKL